MIQVKIGREPCARRAAEVLMKAGVPFSEIVEAGVSYFVFDSAAVADTALIELEMEA